MKHALSFIGGVLLTLLLVALFYPEPKAGNGHNIVIQTDTIIKRDTISDVSPEPKYTSKQPVGTAEVRVPTDCIKMDDATLPHIRADTAASGYAQSLGKNGTDSATIELPIMQSVYESKDYKAYVSGVHARLDSIFVYPLHEVVTIREKQPPKRWHIGVTTGYGLTTKGMQPYVGIGLTYSLISF
ncbi:MAG: hypothetical protein U0K29_10650 [Prevotella sp.]|nr:hypothetical protein [Prevotella sp.]